MAIPAPFGNDVQTEPESLFDVRRATDLSRPALHLIPEAAIGDTSAAGWYRVEVQRPSILKPRTGAHYAQYTPWVPDDGTVARGEYYEAVGGACYLFGRGTWWVRLPQAGALTVNYPMILLDAISVAATGLQQQEAGATDVLLPAAPSSGVVGVASAALLPIDTTRRQVYIKNLAPAGGGTVSLALGAGPAVSGSGVTLDPGDGVVLSQLESGVAIFAISTVAATPVAIQTWN